jgi:hypothetical protein
LQFSSLHFTVTSLQHGFSDATLDKSAAVNLLTAILAAMLAAMRRCWIRMSLWKNPSRGAHVATTAHLHTTWRCLASISSDLPSRNRGRRTIEVPECYIEYSRTGNASLLYSTRRLLNVVPLTRPILCNRNNHSDQYRTRHIDSACSAHLLHLLELIPLHIHKFNLSSTAEIHPITTCLNRYFNRQ